MHFRIAPLFVSEGMNFQQIATDGTSLVMVGSSGTEPCAVVLLDERVRICSAMTQEMIERFHLERVRIDNLGRTGSLPFDDVTRGPNPPDFIVSTAGRETGVDISVVALPERRHAYHRFDFFTDRLRAVSPPLDNLRDTHVLVWFNLGQDLPPKQSDHDAAQDLIDLMRSTRFDRAEVERLYGEMAATGMPHTFPPSYPIRNLPQNEAGFAVSVLPPTSQPSEFRGQTGFECSLQTSVVVSVSTIMREVGRLVGKHDKQGVDWLGLSVGGPDASGWSYPGEDAMFGLIAARQIPLDAQHIRRITLHRWLTGESIDLAVRRVSP